MRIGPCIRRLGEIINAVTLIPLALAILNIMPSAPSLTSGLAALAAGTLLLIGACDLLFRDPENPPADSWALGALIIFFGGIILTVTASRVAGGVENVPVNEAVTMGCSIITAGLLIALPYKNPDQGREP